MRANIRITFRYLNRISRNIWVERRKNKTRVRAHCGRAGTGTFTHTEVKQVRGNSRASANARTCARERLRLLPSLSTFKLQKEKRKKKRLCIERLFTRRGGCCESDSFRAEGVVLVGVYDAGLLNAGRSHLWAGPFFILFSHDEFFLFECAW